ncbi:hypothetical protein UlMin_024654 [Ulmus minor]
MDSLECPFCHILVPSSELQRHANNHFEDDQEEQQQLARDLELAQQLALAPPSPLPKSTLMNNELPIELGLEKNSNGGECSIQEKVTSLIGLQKREILHKVEGGLMVLLRSCLELEPENTTSILSGYVDHFQSIEFEDAGWGCGWRNIQIVSSHLLFQREEAREVLFGGSGFVPDIPSLQKWLEIAWEKGFDEPGSEHFDHKLYGTKKWIGTTECAALLRSFGLFAMVVDFGPKELESQYLSVPGSSDGTEAKRIWNGGKRKVVQVNGPIDRYLKPRNHGFPEAGSSGQEKCSCSSFQLGESSSSGNNISSKSKGQQVLIDWVWNYFSDKNSTKSGKDRVIVSEKGPLYFQHDGHSRTIVGIQVKHQRNGKQQHNLLVLDPSQRTAALEKSLQDNVGWQKHIKRGVHTLKKPQYQLCYVDPGIASGEEMESLKTIDSTFLEL